MDTGCVLEQGSNGGDVYEGGRSEQGGAYKGSSLTHGQGSHGKVGRVLTVFAHHWKPMPSNLYLQSMLTESIKLKKHPLEGQPLGQRRLARRHASV